jgi:hypothetical protein
VVAYPPPEARLLQYRDAWDRRDQLMDELLSITDDDGKPTYVTGALDSTWVLINKTNWGGLTNRWATTKGLYIKALADGPVGWEVGQGHAILEIMQTIQTRDHWKEMMRHVRKENLLRAKLALARTARETEIKALESRWQAKLRDVPPTRGSDWLLAPNF